MKRKIVYENRREINMGYFLVRESSTITTYVVEKVVTSNPILSYLRLAPKRYKKVYEIKQIIPYIKGRTMLYAEKKYNHYLSIIAEEERYLAEKVIMNLENK